MIVYQRICVSWRLDQNLSSMPRLVLTLSSAKRTRTLINHHWIPTTSLFIVSGAYNLLNRSFMIVIFTSEDPEKKRHFFTVSLTLFFHNTLKSYPWTQGCRGIFAEYMGACSKTQKVYFGCPNLHLHTIMGLPFSIPILQQLLNLGMVWESFYMQARRIG
jgi:hypothetical protein